MKNLLSRKSHVMLAMVVFNVVNALVGISGNVVSDEIKKLLEGSSVSAYLLQITVGLIVTGLLAAIWVHKAERVSAGEDITSDTATEPEKALRAFLNDLATRYRERNAQKLDGRHEISLVVSSVHGGSYEPAPGADAVAHAGGAARRVIERFESERRLLLVGNAGSGKTVLLLTLAQHLVAKAQADPGQPLPVVLNLDSWSPEYGSFRGWVASMLTKGYGLSPDFANDLLRERRVICLLDGLDELARNEESGRAAEVRARCFESLNDFLYDGTMKAVVCCRGEHYAEMLRRTGAEPPIKAVEGVNDLTPGQIRRALLDARDSARDKFAASHLLDALERDGGSVYREVLSTPFYFTTALQVFDSTRPPRVDAPDRETLEDNLVAAFVEKKLKVTPSARPFTRAQTLAWLTWLALFLGGRSRVAFELSDLQPSDLRRGWRYRLLFSATCGLVGGLTIGLLRWAAGYGVVAGALLGLIGVYLITEEFARWALRPLRRRLTWVLIVLPGLISCLLAGWLLLAARVGEHGLIAAMMLSEEGFLNALAFQLAIGLIGFFIGLTSFMFVRGVMGMLGRAPLADIVTEDFARWSLTPLLQRRAWGEVLRSGFSAGVNGFVAVSALLGLIAPVALTEMLSKAEPGGGAVGVMMYVLVVGFMVIGLGVIFAPFGVFIGLLLGLLRACRKVARFANIKWPYQRLRAGIAFNVLQMVVIGAAFNYLMIAFTLLSVRYSSNPPEPPTHFWPELFLLVMFGMIGLFKTPLLKHASLRVCLALEGKTPLRYAEFLSYATELGILEKDGGQWRFRHEILQKHFADRSPGGVAAPA